MTLVTLVRRVHAWVEGEGGREDSDGGEVGNVVAGEEGAPEGG